MFVDEMNITKSSVISASVCNRSSASSIALVRQVDYLFLMFEDGKSGLLLSKSCRCRLQVSDKLLIWFQQRREENVASIVFCVSPVQTHTHSYQQMLFGCTSLTASPEEPQDCSSGIAPRMRAVSKSISGHVKQRHPRQRTQRRLLSMHLKLYNVQQQQSSILLTEGLSVLLLIRSLIHFTRCDARETQSRAQK